MARVNVVDPKTATGETKQLLDGVQAQLGVTPNFIRVLANSPKALAAFLGLFGNISQGSLDQKIVERIALAVSERNGCQYCVSAHTAIAGKAGLDKAEIEKARNGQASEKKAEAAVKFALALNEKRGGVSAAEVVAAKEAGITDGEISEIIVNVSIFFLTNLIGKSTSVEIDFPKVELQTNNKAAA